VNDVMSQDAEQTNHRLPIFERWAARYDESVQAQHGIFGSYDQVLAAVISATQLETGMSVLELGIGTGNLAQQLAAPGCEVWGVDFSPAMLAIARIKVPQARLIQMDLTTAWPDVLARRFDRIVANFVLHELKLDMKLQLLQRLAHDHLAQHGRIVVGDVAFPTADQRKQAGAESWDEDEEYWAAAETLAACTEAGLAAAFQPISWCTGVFTFTVPDHQ
jgi:putative AdoMet-dependent methyltransferase